MKRVIPAFLLICALIAIQLIAWLWVKDERRKSFRAGLRYCIHAHKSGGGIYYPLPDGTDGGKLVLDPDLTNAEVDSILEASTK